MHGRLRLRALLPLLVAGAAACGSDTAEPNFGSDVPILLLATTFSPPVVVVHPGEVVHWYNQHDIAHNVTPDNASQPGVWSTAHTSGRGTVLTHTFDIPGQEYHYSCTLHPGMTGSVRVLEE